MNTSRRDFIRVAAAAAGVMANMPSDAAAQASGEVTTHVLPELPYKI